MEAKKLFDPFPEWETERLILRKLAMEDAHDMYVYGSNPEVTKYVTWNTHQFIEDTKAFLNFALSQYERKELAPWGIEWNGTGKLIGTIDFVGWKIPHRGAEIGYVLSQDWWGAGNCH